jgi:hypothetical protein
MGQAALLCTSFYKLLAAIFLVHYVNCTTFRSQATLRRHRMPLGTAVFPIGLRASRELSRPRLRPSPLSGVPDKRAIAMLFPEPTAVLRDADYFRQQHLFIFSDVAIAIVHFSGSPAERCQGQVTTVERVPPGESTGRQRHRRISNPRLGVGQALRNSGPEVGNCLE